MNDVSLKIGLVWVVLAGYALAEFPACTQKPDDSFGTWARFPFQREALAGKVIEIKKSDAELHRTSQGYVGVANTHDESIFQVVVFDVTKDVLFNIYNQIESPDSLYFLVTDKPFTNRAEVMLPRAKQRFELVVLGDDYIKNDDKTVRYIWSKVEPPDFDEKEFWTIEELLVFEEYLTEGDPVIKVHCNQIAEKEVIRDEASGEMTCFLRDHSGSIEARCKILVPEDGEDLFVSTTHIRRWIEFYAKIDTSEDGEVLIRALGEQRRGKGDRVKYKW